MSAEELIKLDGEIITKELLDEIEYEENVERVENIGNSGRYNGYTEYEIKFYFGSNLAGTMTITVYLKQGE